MASQNSKVVAGISATSPIGYLLLSVNNPSFEIQKWEDVECLTDVSMKSVEWADEPTEGLFSRPYLLMHGVMKNIKPVGETEFMSDVTKIEFPADMSFSLGEIKEDVDDIMSDILPEAKSFSEFKFNDTMVPTVDYCYRFTYNELALLATRGAVMEVPEIPDSIAHNTYVDMPMRCDIIHILDKDTNDEFFIVDAPAESFRKQFGVELEVGSLETGYQMVTEIPEVSAMKQFGDYVVLPGSQVEQPYMQNTEELSQGDFDLSNALFQDEEAAPIIGKDLVGGHVTPISVSEKETTDIDEDIEYIDGLVEDAVREHIATDENQEHVQNALSTDSSDEEEFLNVENEIATDIEDIVDVQEELTDEQNKILFGDEEENEESANKTRRANQIRRNQAERLEKEAQAEVIREEINSGTITDAELKDAEQDLGEALFG